MTYFTGKGYGVSKLLDISGKPLLTWTDAATGKTLLCANRCAVTQDPTVAAPYDKNALYTARLSKEDSDALKQAVGGTSSQNLDHQIPLEMGGSNQLANLKLEALDTALGAQPSNPFENGFTQDVINGKISLVDGWREMSKGKGFVLIEDMTVQSSNTNWYSAALSVLTAVGTKIVSGDKASLNAALLAQIKQDNAALSSSPVSLPLRSKIFTEQVNFTAQQLGISTAQAQQYVKNFTAKYADSQGVDKKEVLGALNGDLQQLVGLSGHSPQVDGIDSTTLVNTAFYFLQAAGIVAGLGAISLIVAVLAEPIAEALAAISTIDSGVIISVLKFGGYSKTVFTVTETIAAALGALAIGIPMITKQMYDNGFLAPTQNVDAIKNAMAAIKQLGGSIPSSSSSSSSSSASSSYSGSSVSSSSVSGTSVHVSIVSGGVLGSPATFSPADKDIFESLDEIQAAAEQNLASYIASIGGALAYQLRLVSHITLADGTVRIGTTQRIIHGYTKGTSKTASRPEYKNVTNKFLVADIKYKTLAGVWKKLDEIVIGAVDETSYKPSTADLASLGDAISQYLVANHLGGVTQINLPTTASGQPTQTSPAVMTAPTTTAVPALNIDLGTGMGNAQVTNIPFSTDNGATIQYYTGLDGGGPNLTQRQAGKDALVKQEQAAQQASQPAPVAPATIPAPTNTAPAATYTAPTPTPAATPAPAATQPAATTSAPQVASTGNPKVAAAQTLSDYYTAIGQTLPSVTVRASVYQSLGLGSATMYVGSVAQNASLLAKLKALAGY